MGLKTGIKKAMASIQIAIAPHEIGAPPAETTTNLIHPAEPSEERDLASERAEAGRIIRQLQCAPTAEQQAYGLDQAHRQAITRALLAGGPPKDAIGFNASGRLVNLDGSEYKQPKPQAPIRVQGGSEYVSGKPGSVARLHKWEGKDISPSTETLAEEAARRERIANRSEK